MLNYYYQVAPYILPYLKDRPQSLNRYPNGINGKSFYQKDVTGKCAGLDKNGTIYNRLKEKTKISWCRKMKQPFYIWPMPALLK